MQSLTGIAGEGAVQPLAIRAVGIKRKTQRRKDVIAVEGRPIGVVEHVEGVKAEFQFDVFMDRELLMQRGIKLRESRSPCRIALQVAIGQLEIDHISREEINRTKR